MPASIGSPLFYLVFLIVVGVMIAVDMLALKHSHARPVSTRQALLWSAIWVAVAAIFGFCLWWVLSHDPALGRVLARQKTIEFFTGYVIEKALAVDNIFVFLLIFNFFNVEVEQQRKVLLYGVLGAIILRALMIWLGALLVTEFAWVLYLFGAFLLITGLKMLLPEKDNETNLQHSRTLLWLKKHLRIAAHAPADRFFIRQNGRAYATTLFLTLVMIELSDVVFAVDSIPAIFAITLDPFIVLTSNIFAILGLRALYFLLANMAERFHLLKYGLAAVLVFIGGKMLLVPWVHVQAWLSLVIVFILLALSVVCSLVRPKKALKHE